MNFKTIGLLLLAAGAHAEAHIRLLQPRTFLAAGGEVALQGTVDLPGISRLEVRVQPLASADAHVQTSVVDVDNGLFQGRLSLAPGLNLIDLRTPGRGIESRFAFYNPSPVAAKSWGEKSPVVFTRPEGYVVDRPDVEVEGVVADPAAREVTLIVLVQAHFLAIQGSADVPPDTPGHLTVITAPVENLRFHATLPLAAGHNVILARVGRQPVSPSEVAVVGLAREERDPKLVLDEPIYASDEIRISGRADRSLKGGVDVRVSAMLRADGAGKLTPLDLATRAVPDAQGHFQARLPLSATAARTLRVLPLVRVSAGRARASRLLIQGLPERAP